MRRLPLFLVLVVGCFGQLQGPEFTNGIENGLAWRAPHFQGKLMYVTRIDKGITLFGEAVLLWSVTFLYAQPKWIRLDGNMLRRGNWSTDRLSLRIRLLTFHFPCLWQ